MDTYNAGKGKVHARAKPIWGIDLIARGPRIIKKHKNAFQCILELLDFDAHLAGPFRENWKCFFFFLTVLTHQRWEGPQQQLSHN